MHTYIYIYIYAYIYIHIHIHTYIYHYRDTAGAGEASGVTARVSRFREMARVSTRLASFVRPDKCSARPHMIHISAPCGSVNDSYVIWRIHVWHDTFMCDMTHSCVTCLIHVRHNSFMCDMTHACAPRDAAHAHTHTSATWLINMRHDSFICDITQSFMTWLIHAPREMQHAHTHHLHLCALQQCLRHVAALV